MAKGWNYRSGDWRAVCDSCGEKHYASELRQRWDGFKVCSECWEPRHSQDFLRTKPDNQTVPWSRPQTTDIFLPITVNLQDNVYLYEDVDWVNNLAPVNNTDSVSLSEQVSTVSEYYRSIPLGGNYTTNGVLNKTALNYLSLNSFNATQTNSNETVSLSENIVTSLGFSKVVSESVSISEQVTTFKYISNPLNTPTLNLLSLG